MDKAKTGVRIEVRVQPRARKTELAGKIGDAYKLRLAAPPVDGKANEACIRFLADRCRCGARRRCESCRGYPAGRK